MVANAGTAAPDRAAGVLAELSTESRAFLFDLDGTLLDLAAAPDAVRAPPGLMESLARLSRLTDGAVALVSGRTLADIDALLAPLSFAGAGVHGLQMRAAPGAPVVTADAALPSGLREAALRFAAAHPPVMPEDKGQAIALHYRSAPEAGPAVCAFAADAARRHGSRLAVQHGKMVVELRAPGPDKGAAVRALMALPAFRGRAPLYFGDDLTDEAAFRAARALGGRGVLVGTHGAPTAATARLPSPAALREALAHLARAGTTRCR